MSIFRDPDFAWTVRWIRADAAAIFIATLWAVHVTHGSWTWFFAVFLVPDLSMAGYLFGRRVGAAAYNAGHMFAWPLMLLAVGLAAHGSAITTAALSWTGHIGFDHAMGYGAKLPTSFEHTALGLIGRSRAFRPHAASAQPAPPTGAGG